MIDRWNESLRCRRCPPQVAEAVIEPLATEGSDGEPEGAVDSPEHLDLNWQDAAVVGSELAADTIFIVGHALSLLVAWAGCSCPSNRC